MKGTRTTATGDLPSDYAALVAHHMPHAVRDEVAYDNAMAMIDALTSVPHPSTDQLDYLDTLTVLVEAYERQHHAIDTSDLTGADLLRHLAESNGMTGADLGRLLDIGASAASMILSGRRPITADHARKLGKRFAVNPGIFIR